MRLGRDKKTLILLVLWLGAISAFFGGVVIERLSPHFSMLSAAMFVALGLACIVIMLIPTPLDPRPGHCATCDYDLTGNRSGRCPECGARIEPA